MSGMMGPDAGCTVASRSLFTRRSRVSRFTANVLLAAALLIMFGEGIAVTAAQRKYEVIDFRVKTPVGDWPGVTSEERRYIRRQERADGGWALEYMQGPEEGDALARVFDSAGTEIWAGRVGDRLTLSDAAPAFASRSSFNSTLELYNVELSAEPVYRDPHFPVQALCQSPDGTVFAFVGPSAILLMSVVGRELGRVPLPDSTGRVLSVASSSEGRCVAVGWSIVTRPDHIVRDRPQETRELTSGKPGQVDAGERDSLMIELATRAGAGGNGSISSRYGVSIFDQTGQSVGAFETPGRWAATHMIALSSTSPPSVAVVDAKGASLWTADGNLIWQDSVAFLGSKRAMPRALHVTRDGTVLAVTSRGESESTLWAWGRDGSREAELTVLHPLGPWQYGARFYDEQNGSIGIQTGIATATVRWTSR